MKKKFTSSTAREEFNDMYGMTVRYISAAPGNPSTLWKSKSGRYYSSRNKACEDNPDEAINPDEIELKKSWFAKHQTSLIIVAVLALAGLGYYLVKTKKIVF